MHGVAKLVLWQCCAPCLFAEENPKVTSRNAVVMNAHNAIHHSAQYPSSVTLSVR
jgi:hypothetical protein